MSDEKASAPLTPAMKSVIGVVAVALVIGVIVVIALMNSGAAPGASPEGGPGVTSPARTSSGSASTTDLGPGTEGTPTKSPLPQATPTTGSEVLPPTATQTNRLPSRTPTPPLVTGPLPKSGSKDAGLVAGFPSRIMGPMSGSDIVSSSISTEGSTMQVTLVARTSESADAIRDHYAKQWSTLGLQSTPASDGSLAFSGAHESISLAYGSTGTGNRYSIYAVFRTK